MRAAAAIPWPATSPTVMWRMPSGRLTTSYQSPADLEPLLSRSVTAGDRHAVRRRQSVGEEASLQRHCRVVLALVDSSAGERLHRLVRVRGDDRLLVVVEHPLVPEDQQQRPDRALSARGERDGIEGPDAPVRRALLPGEAHGLRARRTRTRGSESRRGRACGRARSPASAGPRSTQTASSPSSAPRGRRPPPPA